MHLNPVAAAALVFALLTVVTSLADRGRRRKRLERLRALWGAPKEEPRDMATIARYHQALDALDPADAAIGGVDDRTWSDLDLDNVFAAVDRAASGVGQQVLYRRLRTPRADAPELERFDRLTTALGERAELRDEVLTALAPLDVRGAYALPDLFLRPTPPRPAAAPLFPVLLLLSVGSLLLIFVWPRALLVFIGTSLVNIVVRSTIGGTVSSIAQPFRLLNRLIGIARQLAQSRAPEIAGHAALLRESAGRLANLGRAAGWLSWESPDTEDLRGLLYSYVNNAFLLDLNLLTFSLREIGRRRGDIRQLFESVGDVDAALSVASFRAGRPSRWTRPCFAPPGTRPVMRGLVHPLVEEPVANDLVVADEPGVLITGSNMSGKTTFLRAAGLNAVLAQTIHTCLAREYRAPFLVVRSSIAHLDSVLEGKSYYMAEVDSVLRLVHAASDDDRRPHLFLLDELFRGTNAVERIAGAKAVLDYLAAGGSHTAVAATHDFELIELLATRYAPFHFRETVGAGGLSFDYVLRPGPATTRNAIKLLEVMGAPDAVVADALRTAEALDTQRGNAPRGNAPLGIEPPRA